MSAYFERLDTTQFRATDAVEGAWNTSEQHIAPALGLITHAIEAEHDGRRDVGLQLGRVSFDILGTLPIDTMDIAVRVLRPGRTVELVEATLSHDDRIAVIARAWLLQGYDTTRIAGTSLPSLPTHQDVESFEPESIWPGRFVTTVEARRDQIEPGRARFWLRPRVPLLERETISATARTIGLIDIANGITPRVPPSEATFPNVDLSVHLFREPAGEWTGFDTTVTFGPAGIGLTHSILHDAAGPIGVVSQSLTVRPLG